MASPPAKPYDFNRSESWQAYCQSAEMETLIRKICVKATQDRGLQEDCANEARIALACVRPETIKGSVDAYCRNVVRNSVLSYLASFATGDWHTGRTRHKLDKTTGQTYKYFLPARFASLDELTDLHHLQVDENGNVSYSEEGHSDGESKTIRVDADVRENEDVLIDEMTANDLADLLTPEEQELVEAKLDGRRVDRMAMLRFRHRFAVEIGREWYCRGCGKEQPASAFYWHFPTHCRAARRLLVRLRQMAKRAA